MDYGNSGEYPRHAADDSRQQYGARQRIHPPAAAPFLPEYLADVPKKPCCIGRTQRCASQRFAFKSLFLLMVNVD